MREIALVTLFFPTQDHAHHVAEYARHCDYVILCDSSGTGNSALFENISNRLYIQNPDNFGFSRALNIALSPKTYSWEDEDYVLYFA